MRAQVHPATVARHAAGARFRAQALDAFRVRAPTRRLAGRQCAPGPREHAGAVAGVLGRGGRLATVLDACAFGRAGRWRSRGATRAACGAATMSAAGPSIRPPLPSRIRRPTLAAPRASPRAPRDRGWAIAPAARPGTMRMAWLGQHRHPCHCRWRSLPRPSPHRHDRPGRDRRRRHRRFGPRERHCRKAAGEGRSRVQAPQPSATMPVNASAPRRSGERGDAKATAWIEVGRRPPEGRGQPREPGTCRLHRAPMAAPARLSRGRRIRRHGGGCTELSRRRRRRRDLAAQRAPHREHALRPLLGASASRPVDGREQPARTPRNVVPACGGERRQHVANGAHHRRRRRAPVSTKCSVAPSA